MAVPCLQTISITGQTKTEKQKAKDGLIFFLGIILIGCIIQIAGKLKGDILVFPGVLEILKSFVRLLKTPGTYLLIFTTISHLFIAMLLSTVFGILIGMIEGLCPFVRQLLKPLMIMLRSLPMIVIVVIIMVLSEYSRVPYIASLMILIPLISEAACEGCCSIDKELIDVYRLNGTLNLRILLTVYMPLMSGYLRQAYINAVGMGMKMVVSAEYLVQTRNSLGKAVMSSSYFSEYADIYAYALIMILLVLIVSELPVKIANLILKKSLFIK